MNNRRIPLSEKYNRLDKSVNYQKLTNLLNDHGLTLEDINAEFTKQRPAKRNTTGFTYAQGAVLPTRYKITPNLITNGSYSEDTPTLKDWFELDFRNEIIMKHLGDENIIKSYQNAKEVSFDINNDGEIYLDSDGNHRTFNYLLLYYIKLAQAKTPTEKQMVNNQFEIIKPVHHEHRKSMINAFNQYNQEALESIPTLVRNYIEANSVSKDITSGHYLTYSPQGDTYDIHINGSTLLGVRSNNVANIIEDQKHLPEGVMAWDDGKTYYISVHNCVYKTQNYERHLKNLNAVKKPGRKFQKPLFTEDYMIVSDMDTRTFSLETKDKTYSAMDFEQNLGQTFVMPYQNFLNNNLHTIFHKLKKEDVENIYKENKGVTDIVYTIPNRTYKNLTEAELIALEEVVIEELRHRKALEKNLGEDNQFSR